MTMSFTCPNWGHQKIKRTNQDEIPVTQGQRRVRGGLSENSILSTFHRARIVDDDIDHAGDYAGLDDEFDDGHEFRICWK